MHQRRIKGDSREFDKIELKSRNNRTFQHVILGGEDPSIDELKAKMEQLQVQMRQVEETALERELLFEQIDRLVSRLESRKEEGKTPALELSRQLNAAQR